MVVPLVLVGWFGVLISVGLFSDEAPAQVVLFPSGQFMSRIPENASISSFDGWSITLASDEPNFVRQLYAAGARVVLPAGLQGCAGR